MKKAVPPTAAAAKMPTMITAAIRTDTHVLRLLCAIAFLTLLHQTMGFFSGSRIVVGVAQRDRLLQFGARRRRVPGVHRDPPQLEMRAGVDPFSARHGERL